MLNPMESPVSAISYLARAKERLQAKGRENLIYSALELRCGVEARLKEHIAVAVDVSKTRQSHYEIPKLSRTVDEAFGLGDTFLLVFLKLADGRIGQFAYLPVTRRLQDIAARLGDYLHAIPQERVSAEMFWERLRSTLLEGCNLLELACCSEVLRPTFEHGLHFCLPPEDPRIKLLMDYTQGMEGSFQTASFTPTGPLTFYPSEDA